MFDYELQDWPTKSLRLNKLVLVVAATLLGFVWIFVIYLHFFHHEDTPSQGSWSAGRQIPCAVLVLLLVTAYYSLYPALRRKALSLVPVLVALAAIATSFSPGTPILYSSNSQTLYYLSEGKICTTQANFDFEISARIYFPNVGCDKPLISLYLLIGLLVMPSIWFILVKPIKTKVTAIRRRKFNQCVQCGYDIRGSFSNRCSECGGPIATGS